ncbi:MAG: sigma-54-dependent Fis family transcriptional regulator [Deltaproteobacteria bacterium]|jgi:transcriptional regulator with GAF, ATPase, and Fis domain|nr:sigma-54-dependent Fis family transcriptional regulator [Deltaproteobacteria bacterium]
MKDIRFNISLYVIIPVIIAGISLLATIATFNIADYYSKRSIDPTWPVAFWGTIMVVVTAIFGLLIVKFIIDPMKRFARNTENLGVIGRASRTDAIPDKQDDMGRFSQLFDQVTMILSQVEARELFPNIVGQSKVMRGVLKQILQVAKTDSTVLILGETGTGKELIAKSIHQHSQRKEKDFIALNCAAIPENLLESELFGHEKGAFTGASSRKLGKFEIAHNSTLFMDEIGDMPMETQTKVLRAIQENQFERVGGIKPIQVNVRFITATHQDLAFLVDQGSFRQDLFYRLNVFVIHLPPLRERREDIPLLVENFLEKQHKQYTIEPETMQLLTAYDWPGNVRELENAIEAATITAEDVIQPKHLPSVITSLLGNGAGKKIDTLSTKMNLDHRLHELEKGIIMDALTQAGGIQKKAASFLGIKERSLWHRIKKYDIDVTSFKLQ